MNKHRSAFSCKEEANSRTMGLLASHLECILNFVIISINRSRSC